MKTTLLLTLAIIVMAGCSTPRYTYNFDYYDYNSGKKEKAESMAAADLSSLQEQPAFEASASSLPTVSTEGKAKAVASQQPSAANKKYGDLTKSEKKEFRKEVKEHVKSYKQSLRKGQVAQAQEAMAAMDNDLKLAIIFGAVGLTLTLFGGINEAFWVVGVISIVVGVIFLIKWLVRQ